MRRADRLLDLVSHLRGGSVVTARRLAGALEVSERTVYRDVATLQSMGLPIDGAAGLGYVMRREAELPPLAFSMDQAEALALGLAYVERVADPELAAAARAARGKLGAVMPAERRDEIDDAALIAVQRETRRAPPHAVALRRAIRERRRCALSYADGEGRETERTVRPLALVAFSEGWMTATWCELREDFRAFRLDRVARLEVRPDRFPVEPGRERADYVARYADC